MASLILLERGRIQVHCAVYSAAYRRKIDLQQCTGAQMIKYRTGQIYDILEWCRGMEQTLYKKIKGIDDILWV